MSSGLEKYEPWPMDYRLLELMPDQGLIGGVHNAGRTAPAMTDQINHEAGAEVATVAQVSPRLRVMKGYGLCQLYPASGGHVWARTPEGKRFLAKHKLASAPIQTNDESEAHEAGSVDEQEVHNG